MKKEKKIHEEQVGPLKPAAHWQTPSTWIPPFLHGLSHPSILISQRLPVKHWEQKHCFPPWFLPHIPPFKHPPHAFVANGV